MSLDSQLPSGTGRKGALVLVGGSVRAAAQDAARAGWQIVAIDRYGDSDLTCFCSHWFDYNDSSWIDHLAELHAQFLVGIGGFERTHQLEAICRQMKLPIVFISASAARQVNEPANLAQLAKAAGVDFPATWERSSDEGLPVLMTGDSRSPLDSSARFLLKPIQHAGGIGIRWTSPSVAVPTGHWRQQFCAGRSVGASYLACAANRLVVQSFRADGKVDRPAQVQLLGVCQSLSDLQHPTEPFIYHGSFAPIELPETVRGQMNRVGQLAAERFGLVGLFNIDFVLDGSRLALLEINPRYSASMELLAEALKYETGASSLLDWHVRAFQHDESFINEVAQRISIIEEKPPSRFHCKRIVYAPHNGFFDVQTALGCLQQMQRQHRKLQPCLTCVLADIPQIRSASGSAVFAGQPICTVLIHGAEDAHSAITIADDAAKQLQASLKTS